MAEAKSDPNMSAKRMNADYNQKHRRRGRNPRGDE
jgi:hypothetical protein